jgi:hypothetical protein
LDLNVEKWLYRGRSEDGSLGLGLEGRGRARAALMDAVGSSLVVMHLLVESLAVFVFFGLL